MVDGRDGERIGGAEVRADDGSRQDAEECDETAACTACMSGRGRG